MFSAFQLPGGFLGAPRKLPGIFLDASLAFWKLPARFSELQLPTLHGRFPQASCKRSGGCASFLQACVKLPPASNASWTLPASFLQASWRLRKVSASLREASSFQRFTDAPRKRSRGCARFLLSSGQFSSVQQLQRIPDVSCYVSGRFASFLEAFRSFPVDLVIRATRMTQ